MCACAPSALQRVMSKLYCSDMMQLPLLCENFQSAARLKCQNGARAWSMYWRWCRCARSSNRTTSFSFSHATAACASKCSFHDWTLGLSSSYLSHKSRGFGKQLVITDTLGIDTCPNTHATLKHQTPMPVWSCRRRWTRAGAGGRADSARSAAGCASPAQPPCASETL